jgi:hypothetical protein
MRLKKSGKNAGNTNAAKEKTMPSHDDMALKKSGKMQSKPVAAHGDQRTASGKPYRNRASRGGER